MKASLRLKKFGNVVKTWSLGLSLMIFLVACGGGIPSPSNTPGFTINLDKASLSVEAGLSGTVIVTLNAQNGFDDSVLVTASDLPAGVTVSSLSIAAGETSGSLTFEVAATTALGTYTPTLTATSGSLSKSAPLTLEVIAPSTKPSFSLSISPSETSIAPGGSRSVSVTLVRQNSFADAVTVSTNGLPAGVSAAPLTIDAGETAGTLTLIAANDAGTTSSTVTVTGTSGALSDSASFTLEVIAPAPAPDFDLSLEPASLSLSKNASQNVAVVLTRLNNFVEAVTVTAANLPTGVTAGELTIGADASSGTLTLSADDTASTSTGEVTVTAAGGGLSREASLTLSVTAPTPSFNLSIDPTELGLEQGESKELTVSLAKSNGFDAAVTVKLTGLPTGVTANSLTIAAGATTGKLNVSAAANAQVGTAAVTVEGSSGELSSRASLSLNVTAPESFTLSLEPTSTSVSRGASQNVTVRLTKEGGFDAAVAVTVSGLPTGVTAGALTIPAGQTAGTLKLSATNAATLGNATLKVTGKSGALSDDANLALEVTGPAPSFDMSLSESSLSVERGTSKDVTVTIARKNGLTGAVAVTVSGLPAGVTVNALTIAAGATTGKLTLSAGNTASAGQSALSVIGTSGALEQTATLSLTVTVAANESPTITKPADQTVAQNTDSATKSVEVSYTLTDDQPTSALAFSASSSNTDIVDSNSFACTTTKCTFDAKRSKAGKTTVTLTVTDGDGASATTTFDVSVGPRLVISNKDSGDGSLRQAISDADAGDIISFASKQSISLTSELSIEKNVAIDNGGKERSSVDGSEQVRIMTIAAGAKVSIINMYFASGKDSDSGGCIFNSGTLLLDSVGVDGCKSDDSGGGIYNEGTLTVKGGLISRNSAFAGGGIYSTGKLTTTDKATFTDNKATGTFGGGALYIGDKSTATLSDSVIGSSDGPNRAANGAGILNDSSDLILQKTQIIGNIATNNGGGILNEAFTGNLIITDSSVSNNKAAAGGGGIYYMTTKTGGANEIKGSTISKNTAYNGGGIHISVDVEEAVIITNSVVSENTATEFGGGIFNSNVVKLENSSKVNKNKSLFGGGIYNDEDSTVTIKTSTLSQNISEFQGGGISNKGTLLIQNGSTVSSNESDFGGGIYNESSGTLTITDSTVSDNTAENGFGGGIYNQNTATLSSTDVVNNKATRGGGGVFSSDTLILENGSLISENTSDGSGGGLTIAEGNATIAGSSVVNLNEAKLGAGVFIFGTNTLVELPNGFISGNEASEQGGGVYIDSGIFKLLGFSSITANKANAAAAETAGGGIYNKDGTLEGTTDGGNVNNNTPNNIVTAP